MATGKMDSGFFSQEIQLTVGQIVVCSALAVLSTLVLGSALTVSFAAAFLIVLAGMGIAWTVKSSWPFPTLIRIQFRILFWPFVVLAVGATLILIGGVVNFNPYFGVLISVLVFLSTWISGGLVFGVEYWEGAQDFLSTRPVSVRLAFWSKILALILYVALGCLVINNLLSIHGSTTVREIAASTPPPIRVSLLLDLAFVSALFAILSRDLVRGLLIAFVAVVLISVLWPYCLLHLFSISIVNLTDDSPTFYFDPESVVFVYALWIFSPIFLLGVIKATYFTVSKRRFSLPILSWITCVGYLCLVVFAVYCLRSDGKSSIQLVNHIDTTPMPESKENFDIFTMSQEGISKGIVSVHEGKWHAVICTPDVPPSNDSWRDYYSSLSSDIYLYNTDISNSKPYRILVPTRFLRGGIRTAQVLSFFGFPQQWEDLRANSFGLKIRGNYLYLFRTEFQRIAVWSIADPWNPSFIGIAPIPPMIDIRLDGRRTSLRFSFETAMPFERSDGAIGFHCATEDTLTQGILWLEFPVLMKGERS